MLASQKRNHLWLLLILAATSILASSPTPVPDQAETNQPASLGSFFENEELLIKYEPHQIAYEYVDPDGTLTAYPKASL